MAILHTRNIHIHNCLYVCRWMYIKIYVHFVSRSVVPSFFAARTNQIALTYSRAHTISHARNGASVLQWANIHSTREQTNERKANIKHGTQLHTNCLDLNALTSTQMTGQQQSHSKHAYTYIHMDTLTLTQSNTHTTSDTQQLNFSFLHSCTMTLVALAFFSTLHFSSPKRKIYKHFMCTYVKDSYMRNTCTEENISCSLENIHVQIIQKKKTEKERRHQHHRKKIRTN